MILRLVRGSEIEQDANGEVLLGLVKNDKVTFKLKDFLQWCRELYGEDNVPPPGKGS